MRAAGAPPPPALGRSAPPAAPPRASHSEFPIPQPGFRKETNPLCAPWCRFAPLWGSQVWGKSKALDGRILTGEGVGASRGTRLPRRGKEASWRIDLFSFSPALSFGNPGGALVGREGRRGGDSAL